MFLAASLFLQTEEGRPGAITSDAFGFASANATGTYGTASPLASGTAVDTADFLATAGFSSGSPMKLSAHEEEQSGAPKDEFVAPKDEFEGHEKQSEEQVEEHVEEPVPVQKVADESEGKATTVVSVSPASFTSSPSSGSGGKSSCSGISAQRPSKIIHTASIPLKGGASNGVTPGQKTLATGKTTATTAGSTSEFATRKPSKRSLIANTSKVCWLQQQDPAIIALGAAWGNTIEFAKKSPYKSLEWKHSNLHRDRG